MFLPIRLRRIAERNQTPHIIKIAGQSKQAPATERRRVLPPGEEERNMLTTLYLSESTAVLALLFVLITALAL